MESSVPSIELQQTNPLFARPTKNELKGSAALATALFLTIVGAGIALSAAYWGISAVADAYEVPFWAAAYSSEALGASVGIFFGAGFIMAGGLAIIPKAMDLIKADSNK